MKPKVNPNQKDQIKIGIVCNRLGKSGGMERSTFELIQGFKEIGVKPVIFAKEIILSKDDKELLKGIQVEKVATKLIPRLIEDIYFSYRIKKIRKKMGMDVIIGCCRCPGADIVISGGTHPGYVEAKASKSLYDRITIWQEAKQYEQAKIVISHSKRTLEEIKKYFPQMKAIEKVIYPLLELKRKGSGQLKNFRKELGIPEDKVLFLFVSSGHGRKGIDFLKRFFSETKLPVVLGICGRSPDISGLKNVMDFGFQNDLGPYYSAADYTVLPSLYEPFGRTPVESLTYGTPVLISDALGCDEIIKPECKIVFKAGDYGSFCEAMHEAVFRRELYKGAANKDTGDFVMEDCEIPTVQGQALTILELAKNLSEHK